MSCGLALLLAAVLASACGGGKSGSTGSAGSPGSAGAPQRGGTLTYARTGEPSTLDPNNGLADIYGIQVQMQIFSRLVEVRPGSNKVVPGLARSWSESKDGLSWTFHLRDAKFSNGRPVTSADVVFSLERVLDPKVDTVFAVPYNEFMKSVQASDSQTVVIHLKHPYSGLPLWLSAFVPGIVSKVDMKRMGVKGYAARPIGSGPFTLQSWRRGSQLILVRNPYYWRKGLPYLDKVVINTVANDNTRVLQIQSGQVDLADDLPFSQISKLEADRNLTFIARAIGPVAGVFLNLNKRPLGELEVRQALNYATPKAQINEVVFKGRGEIANSIAPKVGYWSKDVKPYPYDVAKAKELLAKSSVPNGFNVKLEIVGTDEPSAQTAQILQKAWGDIGVRVKIVQSDIGTAFTHILGSNFETNLMPPSAWGEDIPSEEEHFINIAGAWGRQVFGYDSAKVRRLTRQATTTNDEKLRNEVLPQIQQAMMDDPCFVPIVFAPVRAAFRKNVHGFDYTQTNWAPLESVWLNN
jgi:peptide/nickel transport system substrate-binding protein